MLRFMTIACSFMFAVLVALPGQVSPANITETSAAIGKDCAASENYSTAMGYNTTASGYNSTAMGYHTEAIGNYSTAMGYHTDANGHCSTSMGNGTIASNYYSTATGFYTEASGYASVAMGDSTKATDYASIVCGYNTEAGGTHSFAGGAYMQLTADADHTFVWGYADEKQPISTSNAFLIFPTGTKGNVGIGTPEPVKKLHIRERSNSLGAAILLDSTGEQADVSIIWEAL